MDAAAATLSYPFAAPPPPGTLATVAPGVHWLRMPLPFALDHINLWVVDEPDGGVSLIDSGLANDATRALWETLLAGPLAGRPVRRLLCTHFHPDHMGLAGWMEQRLGAPLWATLGEWGYGSLLATDSRPGMLETQLAFYRRAGFSAAQLDAVRARGNQYAKRVIPPPIAFRRILDGEELILGGRTWVVVVGRGHAPEHACLHCPELGLLISGDQVLPRISPNVSVWPQEPDADPLALFMASLRAIRARVPADTLTLPSHGLPFHGLHARIDDLLAHHDERLAETLAACAATPCSAGDLLPVLFRRPLDEHQTFFAIGETLAHLHRLWAAGALTAEDGADGVRRFRQA